MKARKKILVIGGSGTLGKFLVQNLARRNDLLVHIGDYKIRRGTRLAASLQATDAVYVDIENEKTIEKAIQGFDCVIVAFTQRTPLVQKVCFESNIPCIDLNPYFYFATLIDDLKVAKESPSITMAGLFPGLSGIAVHTMNNYFDTLNVVDVYYLQNSRSHLGKRAVSDSINIMSELLPHKTKPMSHIKEVELLDNTYEMRQIENGEKILFRNELGLNKINYWTGWGSKLYSRTISGLIQHGVISNIIPVLQQFSQRQNPNNKPIYIKVAARGVKDIQKTSKEIIISPPSVFEACLTMVELLIDRVTEATTSSNLPLEGLSFPYEWLSIQDIREYIIESDE